MKDESEKLEKKWPRIGRLGMTRLGKPEATKYCKANGRRRISKKTVGKIL